MIFGINGLGIGIKLAEIITNKIFGADNNQKENTKKEGVKDSTSSNKYKTDENNLQEFDNTVLEKTPKQTQGTSEPTYAFKVDDNENVTLDTEKSLKETLEKIGVKIDDDKKYYINVQNWDDKETPNDDLKPNNCLERIAANYKPENMSLNEAMELIMKANPDIYDSGRKTIINDSKINTVIYNNEKMLLPDEFFEDIKNNIEEVAKSAEGTDSTENETISPQPLGLAGGEEEIEDETQTKKESSTLSKIANVAIGGFVGLVSDITGTSNRTFGEKALNFITGGQYGRIKDGADLAKKAIGTGIEIGGHVGESVANDAESLIDYGKTVLGATVDYAKNRFNGVKTLFSNIGSSISNFFFG